MTILRIANASNACLRDSWPDTNPLRQDKGKSAKGRTANDIVPLNDPVREDPKAELSAGWEAPIRPRGGLSRESPALSSILE